MTKQYELMVLLPVSFSAEQLKQFSTTLKNMVENRSGKILEEQSMGRRQMAYEIKKQREAYYLLYQINLDTAQAQAFERDVLLNDDVIRSLFLITDLKKKATK